MGYQLNATTKWLGRATLGSCNTDSNIFISQMLYWNSGSAQNSINYAMELAASGGILDVYSANTQTMVSRHASQSTVAHGSTYAEDAWFFGGAYFPSMDGTAKTTASYQNNTTVNRSTNMANVSAGSFALAIGQGGPKNVYSDWNGFIAETAIFAVTDKTAADNLAAAIYNGGTIRAPSHPTVLAVSGATLVNYWPMTTTSTTADSAGSDTLTNNGSGSFVTEHPTVDYGAAPTSFTPRVCIY